MPLGIGQEQPQKTHRSDLHRNPQLGVFFGTAVNEKEIRFREVKMLAELVWCGGFYVTAVISLLFSGGKVGGHDQAFRGELKSTPRCRR